MREVQRRSAQSEATPQDALDDVKNNCESWVGLSGVGGSTQGTWIPWQNQGARHVTEALECVKLYDVMGGGGHGDICQGTRISSCAPGCGCAQLPGSEKRQSRNKGSYCGRHCMEHHPL